MASSPTHSIFELIFVGAIGGISANFLAQYLWKRFTKPVLDFEETGKGRFLPTDRGNLTKMVYRAPIENTGRSSAINCKAELRMRGAYDGDRYEVQTQVPWSNGGGMTQKINRGETTTFQILRYEAGGLASVDISIPEGPSCDDRASIIKYIYDDNDELERIEHFENLPKDRFLDDIDWAEQVLTVSSDNTEVVEADLDFGDQTTDSYGIQGTRIHICQR